MWEIGFYDSIREIFKVPLTTVIQMLVYEDCTSNNEVWSKLIYQTFVELCLVSCKPHFISTNASNRNHAISKFHTCIYPYKGEHICMTIRRIRRKSNFINSIWDFWNDFEISKMVHWKITEIRESIQGLVHSPVRTLKKYQHCVS